MNSTLASNDSVNQKHWDAYPGINYHRNAKHDRNTIKSHITTGRPFAGVTATRDRVNDPILKGKNV